MDKKAAFKEFAKNNPILKNHIEKGTMTWQKFYEIYDIYGDDNNTWSKYLTPDEADRSIINPTTIAGLTSLAKKVNMATVQKHIGTAQKAINLFKEFGPTKGPSNTINAITNKGPLSPRPLNKFFED